MTVEQAKEEFGDTPDSLCHYMCNCCVANDWYCPTYCNDCEWVQKHYDKAIERLAKLDGDLHEFWKRLRTWKGYGDKE